MYQNVSSLASHITAQTDWMDSRDKAGEVPQLFYDLKRAKNYLSADWNCFYGISFFNLDNGEPKLDF
jgi:hypothetical protein